MNEEPKKKEKYYYAVGKRKNAVAAVKLFQVRKRSIKKEKESEEADGNEVENKTPKVEADIMVNRKPYTDYFCGIDHEFLVLQPLKVTNTIDRFRFEIRIKGSGIASQAGAARHGISKALVIFDKSLKDQLKPLGLLKRDARMVERKKYGFKKARRQKQWSKR